MRGLAARHVGWALALTLAASCGGRTAEAPAPTRPGLEAAVRPEMGSPQPGEAAPEFTLPTSSGGTFSLADARGAWVVLHFTASFCPYCDVEVEHLSRMADDYAGEPVRVLLVDVKEPVETWRAYAAARVRSPHLVLLEDTAGEVAARYAPKRAQPSFEDRSQVVLAATLIIDPEGIIRLFLLVDSRNFDPTLAAVRRELDRLRADEPLPEATRAVDEDAPSEPAALAPDRVVTLIGEPSGSAAPGTRGTLVLRFHVADGYHIMSDRPSSEFYVPTAVALSQAPGVRFGAPEFPPPVDFPLLDSTIRTFLGEVVIRVPFEVEGSAACCWREVTGELAYQACTESSCLFPATLPFRARIDVAGGR